MDKLRKILLISLFAFGTVSCTVQEDYVNSDTNVNVTVAESEHFDVKSANPLTIKRGETAKFEIEYKEDYGFKSAGEAYYENNFLCLENVQYSQTIDVTSVKMISVYLNVEENSHFTVTSQNPVKVEEGQNASFDLEFEEGYCFESTTNGVYQDGKLIIENVVDKTNVSIIVKKKGNIHLTIDNDNNLGKVLINGNELYSDYRASGETATISAVPADGAKFICWSKNKDITEAMPYSFERELKYTFSDDATLVANYWKNNENTIIYNANGGATRSGDTQVFYPHYKPNAIRYNTIQGSKCFYKEGYLLDSWNTKADGTGERIGLGSRTKIENDGPLKELYAQWVKETDIDKFSFEECDDGYAVVDCASQDQNIVIPNEYNDKPVVLVKTGAFTNLNFENLYLCENLKEVQENALVNCNNFYSLHYFDSLETISQEFSPNKKPSRIFINANTDPAYTGEYQSLFARKTDYLLETNEGRIVILGNSNTYLSIDGQMISEDLGKDVISLGVQSGIGIAWEIAVLKGCFKDNNNIIILCSEFDGLMLDGFTQHKFYAAESNYDLLSLIDFNELSFYNVFYAYSKFKSLKNNVALSTYMKSDYLCDEYGCNKLDIKPYREEEWFANPLAIDFNFYNNGQANWCIDILNKFTNSNTLISCCSYNKYAIKQDKLETFYGSYQSSISEYWPYEVISKLEDYGFSGTAFHNDNYHLIYSYAVIRTEFLIRDIKNSVTFNEKVYF